ncbi:viroplasmin family protein [Spiroplasma turonicum]|uniref:ribonuclease H n=1 Tax=Spiroplasma turonicum TaxID=216946 RepID=A0A0K1P7L2_9MOLU|nr:ribonuclease H family protein [Spiroplasma turonicum]AKU80301.1 Ribonuclease H related protein [Spiroplasma turonicum]ALX71302.1 ribonuclease HI [Spiroplasma turonicum]
MYNKVKKYYAVKVGKEIGIFDSWEKCKQSVSGYPNSIYKAFSSYEDAEKFINNKKNINLIKDENYEVVAYTDGSYDINNKNIFKSGVVLIKNNIVITEMSYSYNYQPWLKSINIAGEVSAVIEVLNYCLNNNIKSVLINVDYIGLISWANDTWSANTSVSNDYKKYIATVKDKINISFNKVKAHSNDKYNERADQLAKLGKVLKNKII